MHPRTTAGPIVHREPLLARLDDGARELRPAVYRFAEVVLQESVG
jgi:hypothetical protein